MMITVCGRGEVTDSGLDGMDWSREKGFKILIMTINEELEMLSVFFWQNPSEDNNKISRVLIKIPGILRNL